jgi:predicted nucleotidyltransferase
MRPISERHIDVIAYGSIARGDVNITSDIDIFVPNPPAPALLQTYIEMKGIRPTYREIVQATPTYAAKGYIYIEENRSYSFPLVPLRTIEKELYDFAGSINRKEIQENKRVLGIDKRLLLIQPTELGHIEIPITGMEGAIAKILGISTATVQDRVRTLLRRQKTGRTGVYLKHVLEYNETFGDTYNRLARTRPPLRRRIRS